MCHVHLELFFCLLHKAVLLLALVRPIAHCTLHRAALLHRKNDRGDTTSHSPRERAALAVSAAERFTDFRSSSSSQQRDQTQKMRPFFLRRISA